MSSTLELERVQDQHLDQYDVHYEEEALSLSDFPINNANRGNDEDKAKEEGNQTEANDVDFDFGSLIGSLSTLEAEMCSADEVFSGGQMLPFRHSVSSEMGLSRSRNSSWRSMSRSESMDRRGFGSRSNNSSRSSSVRSQYSTTSNNSTSSSISTSSNITSSSVKTIPIAKTKVRNNFHSHSHPSPKPQIWSSGARSTTFVTPIGKKTSMWDVLRLGLVRTPEIELQDLKQRHRTSTSSKTFIMPRNNSTGSNNSNSSNNNNSTPARKSCSRGTNSNNTPVIGSKIGDLLLELQKKNQPQIKSNNGGFFKSCKCSVMAIEPMPTRDIDGKNGYFGTRADISPKKSSSADCQVLNEDKDSVQKKLQHEQQKRNKHLRQGKKVVSHHRTFEWLRDLSHASVLNA